MENKSAQAPVQKTNPVLIILFWIYVTVPLAWGVYNTLLKTADLFEPPRVHSEAEVERTN